MSVDDPGGVPLAAMEAPVANLEERVRELEQRQAVADERSRTNAETLGRIELGIKEGFAAVNKRLDDHSDEGKPPRPGRGLDNPNTEPGAPTSRWNSPTWEQGVGWGKFLALILGPATTAMVLGCTGALGMLYAKGPAVFPSVSVPVEVFAPPAAPLPPAPVGPAPQPVEPQR
jgi:hypothetical protein